MNPNKLLKPLSDKALNRLALDIFPRGKDGYPIRDRELLALGYRLAETAFGRRYRDLETQEEHRTRIWAARPYSATRQGRREAARAKAAAKA